MVFEHIERLQRQLTDKYVVVDDSRPELKRFSGMTGVVKTVNFGGRALVQFDANNNIGWFDIDPQFLKVIDAPLAKPAAKETKAEKKAAPAKVEKPAAKAEAKPVSAKPAAGGASVADILAAARGGAKPAAAAPASGGSVADILAAARAGTKPAAKAEEKPEAKPKTTAEILAAARTKPEEASAAPAAAGPTAATKVDPKKLSMADMLAMARGEKPAGETAPQSAPAAKPAAVVEAPAPEPELAPAAAVEESPAAGGPVKVDRTKMDVAAMIAYCRKVDGKG